MQRQTTNIKPNEVKRQWFIVDAKGKHLGRLATEVAKILMGKNKPSYTPNVDCGDYVIIINASEIDLAPSKARTKFYYNHSQYLGGLRTRSAKVMKENYPCEMVERSVWGMLPKGPLGRKIYKKLFVYKDANHKHAAQNPQVLEIK